MLEVAALYIPDLSFYAAGGADRLIERSNRVKDRGCLREENLKIKGRVPAEVYNESSSSVEWQHKTEYKWPFALFGANRLN